MELGERPKISANDALLIFPPGWDNGETPPAGPAYLAGHARANGFPGVRILDANQDYLFGLLQDSSELNEARTAARLALDAMNRTPQSTNHRLYVETAGLAAVPVGVGQVAFDAYVSAMAKKEELMGFVVGQRYARWQFGGATEQFLGRFDRFVTAARRLDMRTILGLDAPNLLERPDTLRRAAEINDTDSASYYDRYITERVLPYVAREKPSLVGITFNSPSQLEPGIRIASYLREAFPKLPLLAGGNQVFYAKHVLRACPWLGRIVDGLVFHEGETPFVACLETADEPKQWRKFPNVGIYDNGVLQLPLLQKRSKPDVVPDYAIVSLLDEPPAYSSRRTEVVATRGCYRPRCKFCTHPVSYVGPNFTGRDFRRPEKGFVSRMLGHLQAEGKDTFYFIDEAMPPVVAEELAKSILSAELSVRWGSYIRFERPYANKGMARLLRASGCRLVEIGLESASQRVLDAMDKGITIDGARKGLDNLLANGIQPNVFIMFGFPTETESEAQETLNFIREYAPRGVRFIPEIFGLPPDSLAMKHREELGIELLVPEEDCTAEMHLTEGVHWKRQRGIDCLRATELYWEAVGISRACDNSPSLEEDSTVVINSFAGIVPIKYPEAFVSPPTDNNLVGGKLIGSFGLRKLVPSEKTTHLLRILHENWLVTDATAALIKEFAVPTNVQDAERKFIATQGLNHKNASYDIRRLLERLVDRGVLLVVPQKAPK